MDQGRQAGCKDDLLFLSPFPPKPSATSAELAGLQLGQFVEAAGVTKPNRELVAHEFTATAGEDGRTAGETCPLLLALGGGEPSDEAALWEYGAADRGAVTYGGIAEAVGPGNRSRPTTGVGCPSKSDLKDGASSHGLALATPGSFPGLGPGQTQEICAEIAGGVYSAGLLLTKTEISVYGWNRAQPGLRQLLRRRGESYARG